MAIFRQYIAPFLILLVFLVALVAVSSRIFLPSDMASPAPVEEVGDAGAQALAPIQKSNLKSKIENLKSIDVVTTRL